MVFDGWLLLYRTVEKAALFSIHTFTLRICYYGFKDSTVTISVSALLGLRFLVAISILTIPFFFPSRNRREPNISTITKDLFKDSCDLFRNLSQILPTTWDI
jgi:hypothetical protein